MIFKFTKIKCVIVISGNKLKQYWPGKWKSVLKDSSRDNSETK